MYLIKVLIDEVFMLIFSLSIFNKVVNFHEFISYLQRNSYYKHFSILKFNRTITIFVLLLETLVVMLFCIDKFLLIRLSVTFILLIGFTLFLLMERLYIGPGTKCQCLYGDNILNKLPILRNLMLMALIILYLYLFKLPNNYEFIYVNVVSLFIITIAILLFSATKLYKYYREIKYD